MSFGSIGKGTLPLIERYIAFVLTTFFIFLLRQPVRPVNRQR
jgi:homospermidine synthase